MNYRHAFHAGNFSDVMKHVVCVSLMQLLTRKPAPLFVLDTHAGRGRYDLGAGPALRTGEWRTGIGRLINDPPEPLANYLRLVHKQGLYPGSPALLRAMLRPDDRLVCCELHPDDFLPLKQEFGRDRQVSLHLRDGWEALRALLPPTQKRGLVLIDPPYEAPDEFFRLTDGLRNGVSRFRTGVFVAWYPIKHRAPVREFHAAMKAAGIADILAVELHLREPVDAARLNGCGLLIVNPPFGFEAAAPALLGALVDRLGNGEPGQGFQILRVADE